MVEERKCPNCGRVIPNDAFICPYCGKKFVEIRPSGQITEKKHTGFGTASLILGIIAMCLIWTSFFGSAGGVAWMLVLLPLGVLAIIFGGLGYWRKKFHDIYGLVGFILGILVILLGFIFAVITTIY